MATLLRRPNGKVQLLAYDSVVRRKRYVATFDTEEEAEAVARQMDDAPARPRLCIGCSCEFVPSRPRQARCRPRCGLRDKPGLKSTDHWVYYCSDANGRLLYIGVTSEGIARPRAHARYAAWWSSVANIRIEHYATRELAEWAEAEAILYHLPSHNKRGRGYRTR